LLYLIYISYVEKYGKSTVIQLEKLL